MENILSNLKIEEKSSENITDDIAQIVEQSQRVVYTTIDIILLQRNWLIGKRIHEEITNNSRKKNYGKVLIKKLAIKLSLKYGDGFSVINLYYMQKFYTLYKTFFTQRVNNLSKATKKEQQSRP